MKRCPYCGQEYNDDVVDCPQDQNVLEVCFKPNNAEKASRPERAVRLKVGAQGRWLIFSGVNVAVLGLLLQIGCRDGLDHGLVKAIGEKALPYVLFFCPVTVVGIGYIVFKLLPQKIVFPLGIGGWIIGLLLIYEYFWFGPGSFGH